MHDVRDGRRRTARGRWQGLATALAAGVLTACGGGPGDTGPLQADGFQPVTVTDLPGGGRVAVGSPDGHDVVVQWQAEGSDGWSDQSTVYTEPEQFTHDVAVEAAGDTVVIGPDFWVEQTLDDDYAPTHSAQVVCRDRTCAPGHRTPDGTLSSTDLDRAGTYATFSLGGDDLLVWDDGSFSTEKTVGLPRDAARATLPDGTLVAVDPQEHRGLCRYRLLTAAEGTTTYVARAVSGDHPALLPCSVAGVEATDDTVSVLLEELPDPVEFTREKDDGAGGRGWRAVEPAAPLQAYPDTRGRTTLATLVTSRSDGSDVAIGSPDTRRIMAQLRAKGSTEWSAPVQVATAPAGTSCRFQSVDRDEQTVADLVSCFDDSRPFELGTSVPVRGIALATSDGRTWQTETLDRPQATVGRGAGLDRTFVGATASYLWRPGEPMRRIDLPTGPRDGLVVTPDDRVIRTVGDVDGGTACRPGYQLADLDATSWPAARRFPDTSGLGPFDDGQGAVGCSAGLYYLDDAFQVTIGSQEWEGTLTRRGGDWVAARRDSGF
jgi:hypothetical protein